MERDIGINKVADMSNVKKPLSRFLLKCTVKSPIKLTGITQGVSFNNKEPTMFFNSYRGSRIADKPNITFENE